MSKRDVEKELKIPGGQMAFPAILHLTDLFITLRCVLGIPWRPHINSAIAWININIFVQGFISTHVDKPTFLIQEAFGIIK